MFKKKMTPEETVQDEIKDVSAAWELATNTFVNLANHLGVDANIDYGHYLMGGFQLDTKYRQWTDPLWEALVHGIEVRYKAALKEYGNYKALQAENQHIRDAWGKCERACLAEHDTVITLERLVSDQRSLLETQSDMISQQAALLKAYKKND